MVILTPNQGLISDGVWGRFGRPSGFGAYVFGDNRFGEFSMLNGVYQKHVTKRGKKFNLHRDNWPHNPRTEAQTVRRNLFKQAIIAWHELDSERQQEYTDRVYPPGQHGVNRFISEYMKSH
jgi:hypothetical protein